jgi:hypothetical protein
MSSMLDPNAEVVIHSVSFPGEYTVEIQYFEKRHQQLDKSGNTVAGLLQTLVLDAKTIGVEEQYSDIMEAVAEMIDEGLRAIRNPPERKDPRVRRRTLDNSLELTYEDEE